MDSGRQQVVAQIQRQRVSAIIRADEALVAADAIRAAVAGGFRTVEFTLTTPEALRLISDFARDPELLVGAGTVLSPQQARAAADAGARFIVSPVCDPEVIAEAKALDLVCIPGTFTPTEMLAAHRCGADLVKLFPAPDDIAAHVAAILGPLPFLRIFPTAGVTAENFVGILRAGAAGVGFTHFLFAPADLSARNFAAIQCRAADIIRRLKEA